MTRTTFSWLLGTLTCTVGLVVTTGCEKTPPASNLEGVGENAPPPVTADDVKKEAGEAAEVTKEYLSQKKDEFLASMKVELAEMDTTLEKMKVEGAELKGEAKEKWDVAMKKLEQEKAEFSAKIETWKESSGDAWEETKSGLENAWQELKTAKDDAMQQLKESDADKPDTDQDQTE